MLLAFLSLIDKLSTATSAVARESDIVTAPPEGVILNYFIPLFI
jgi:hypothetical protein